MTDYVEPPLLSGDLSDKHRYLGYLLMSPAWKEVFLPKMAERAKTLYERLIDPKANRKETLPDDYIRGQLAVLKWIIEWPEKEMQLVAQQLREHEVLDGERVPKDDGTSVA